MAKKTRSMRGEIVDWDLAQIKSQMESAPPPVNVQARQDFIDQKLRRRVKRVKESISKIDRGADAAPVGDVPVEQTEKIDEVKVEAVEKQTPAKKRTVKRKAKAKPETKE